MPLCWSSIGKQEELVMVRVLFLEIYGLFYMWVIAYINKEFLLHFCVPLLLFLDESTYDRAEYVAHLVFVAVITHY